MDAQLFLTILLWLIIGSATAYYASQRGRDPLLWFMIGMMLGLLGLLLLFVLPIAVPETAETITKSSEEKEDRPPPSPEDLSNDYLIKDWYYYDNHQARQGPVRYEILKALWQSGDLTEDSFVWCEGMNEWKPIEQIPSLHAHLVLQDDRH